mmetsp:Transcript_3950/g.5825  ORF Transcript_3950/g.5825 Transcript_3950/m.5825 type:complete len:208 (-) Transcript_3950:259-882(-)
MIIIFFIGFVIITGVGSTEILIKSRSQFGILPRKDFVKNGGKVYRESVTEDRLYKDTNDLDVHPRHEGFTVMGLAPSHQAGLHTVDFDLELFQGHGGFGRLRGIVGKLAHEETLFLAGFGEFLFEIDFGSGLEVVSFKVSGFVLSLEDGDGVECGIHVGVDLLQGSWDDRRSAFVVSVDLGTELDGFSEFGWVAAPIGTAVTGDLVT